MSADHCSLYPVPDMQTLIPGHDVVLITLDTLRFDAAQEEFHAGRLPILARHLEPAGFECRHTPASFTYAAHHAFFAGFLPTPLFPGPHPRLFALEFAGSESIGASTCVLSGAPSVPQALALLGYRTICIGGTAFFNQRNPLGAVLPALFDEAHWSLGFGVTSADSTEQQVALARQRLDAVAQPVFLFINISALHQPNCHYLQGCNADDYHSHRAALRYVDAALLPLLQHLQQRGPALVIVCSDHGTAYGEDGYRGHRHAHPVVMQVPYAHFLIGADSAREASP